MSKAIRLALFTLVSVNGSLSLKCKGCDDMLSTNILNKTTQRTGLKCDDNSLYDCPEEPEEVCVTTKLSMRKGSEALSVVIGGCGQNLSYGTESLDEIVCDAQLEEFKTGNQVVTPETCVITTCDRDNCNSCLGSELSVVLVFIVVVSL